MKTNLLWISVLASLLVFGSASPSQEPAASPQPGEQSAPKRHEQVKKSPSGEIGKGGKDIGVGAAKGSGDLAKGTAGFGKDLATGHPVRAGASMGKGAGGFGKNVGVGTAKGTANVSKGVGGESKKLGKKIVGKDHKEKTSQ